MKKRRFELRDYQKDARKNMDLLAKETENFQTVLSVAVGGGKTVIATDFVSRTMLPKGYQCVWIAPSVTLLEQARKKVSEVTSSRRVYQAGGRNKISGCPVDFDYLLMTVQYASKHLKDLEEVVGDKSIILVTDECHHIVADTFQKVFQSIKDSARHTSLLGLTATPTRTNECERPLLGEFFTVGVRDGKVSTETGVVYSIDLPELVKRGWLATPIVHLVGQRVCTWQSCNCEEDNGVLVENEMTYNTTIVSTYMDNKEMYRKTIIFAKSRRHAVVLYKMFLDKGVPCGIAITNPQQYKEEAGLTADSLDKSLEEFREGRISVLITCKLLTEGFDVPETNTVFLTKKKYTQIELMQSIGRAMRRKPGANEAYLVCFSNVFLDREFSWMMPDILTKSVADKKEKKIYRSASKYKSILQYLRFMEESNLESVEVITEDVFEELYGFYFYEDEFGKIHQVILYESQRSAFDNFLDDLKAGKEIDLEETAMALSHVGDLIPITEGDLSGIVAYYKATAKLPQFYPVGEETDKILSSAGYAAEVGDKSVSAMKNYLREIWKKQIILRLYYPSVTDFYNDVVAVE